MKSLIRICLPALAALSLAACDDAENSVRIGSKSFGENRVLAEMMAAVVAEQGLPVDGVVEYENTAAVLEALRRGDIDAYPEYNGTGLVMLGQAPMTDGDAALARVKEVYEPLGISWRQRIGFANDYGLAMLPARADELNVETMGDLASVADEITLGVEDDFVDRPLDGLAPMTDRYGFEFANVREVPLADRGTLYDLLLDGEVDVIEVFTTDGQIADFNLVLLEDNLAFFPVYEAVPIVRQDALAEHQGLGGALDSLGGAFDAAAMQEINRRVDLEGRSPRAVARDALARAGLIESGAVEAASPLDIAADPAVAEGPIAANALRAVRRAFPGREVRIAPTAAPLETVAAGDARLALAGAQSFFDLDRPSPQRDERFEAVAAAGRAAAHVVVSAAGGVSRLSDATTLAVGPEGGASHALGAILIEGLGLDADLAPVGDGGVEAALEAAAEDGVAAIVVASVGDREIAAAFSTAEMRLLPVEGWSDGPNLVRWPFLRPIRIPAGTYPAQFGPVETYAVQIALAGPAPGAEAALIGEQGPGATAAPTLKPLPGTTVEELAESIQGGALIDPTLRQAAAFAPTLPEPPAAMNPAADVSVLNVALVLMFVWIFWLYVRPEYR